MNSLSLDITCQIFQYLSLKDFARAGAVCNNFYQTTQNEKFYHTRLMLPKLNPKIVQENALELWNYYPEGNFTVDAEGRLSSLASYHFIARFSKWCDSDTEKKVNKIIEITFQEIYRLNQLGYAPGYAPPPISVSPCSHRRLYVWHLNWFYSNYHPADYLADKILGSELSEPKILKAALLVKEQAGMYDKITKKYGNNNNPDARIAWADVGLDEALFCKDFK